MKSAHKKRVSMKCNFTKSAKIDTWFHKRLGHRYYL